MIVRSAQARLDVPFRRNRLQAFIFCFVPWPAAARKVSAKCPIERSPAAIVDRNLPLRPESRRSTRSAVTPSPSVAPAAAQSARHSVPPADMTAVAPLIIRLVAAIPVAVAAATHLGRASSTRRSAPSVARKRKFRSSRATTSRSIAVNASSCGVPPHPATGTATRFPAPAMARGSCRITAYQRVRPGIPRPVASQSMGRVIPRTVSPRHRSHCSPSPGLITREGD